VEQETIANATAEVADVAETVVLTLYDKIGEVMTGVFLVAFIALILYRYARSFHSYIYTGGFTSFIEGSVFATLISECPEDSPKAFFTATHPFGIFVDGALCFIILLAMPFAWGVITPVVLIVLLAYVMRQRIARKQDFVAKLDGTHSDLNDSSSGDMIQQSATSSMRGH